MEPASIEIIYIVGIRNTDINRFIRKMRYFSRYCPKGLIGHTDAKSIVFMANAHFSSGNQRLERWACKLLNYDIQFKIEYTTPNIGGIVAVDALSRQYYKDRRTQKNRPKENKQG